MRPLALIAAIAALPLAGMMADAQQTGAGSQAADTGLANPPTPGTDPWTDSFRPLPFHEMFRRVNDRYDGRLLAAQTRPPRPYERAQGIALIYEFRLLTQARHILNIRMDARTGRFLEVAGQGQVQARRTTPGSDAPRRALRP